MALEVDEKKFTSEVRVRFAPSPTGWIHIGTLRLVMFNYIWAKKCGGKLVLRVEDTDVERTVEGGVDAIYETFEAFGIEFDEGPQQGGDYAPYVQSERLPLYKKYAEELVEKGAAYYCFCSEQRLLEVRERQIANKTQPMYDGTCRDIPLDEARKRIEQGEKAVVRLKVPRTGVTEYDDVIYGKLKFKNSLIDDQILLKSDGFPTYHFAVVIDDHLMNISHITRGVEYISSAPKIVMLYNALGWEMPYLIQTPHVLNPDGRKKLSKRGGANAAVKFLRQGYLIEALWNFLMLLGWAPSGSTGNKDEIYTMDDFVKLFDLRRVKKAGARFLNGKLDFFNGYYIRKLSIDDFAKRIFEWSDKFVTRDFVSDRVIGLLDWEVELRKRMNTLMPQWRSDPEKFNKVLNLVHDRVKYLSELPDLTGFFYEKSLVYRREDFDTLSYPDLGAALGLVWSKLKPIVEGGWEQASWESTIRSCADELGWKHGDLFMLIRLAVTGRRMSPPLMECMEVLGVQQCDNFISAAVKFLSSSHG